MGVAALVLGIVSIICALTPCGVIAWLPALVGLILGIVDVSIRGKKNLPKGKGIAGIVLNGLALIFIAFWTLAIGAAAVATEEELENFEAEVNEIINSYEY